MTADDVRALLAALDAYEGPQPDSGLEQDMIYDRLRALQVELSRPLAEAWLRDQARIEQLEERIGLIVEMHGHDKADHGCTICGIGPWPCPTRRALLGEEATK